MRIGNHKCIIVGGASNSSTDEDGVLYENVRGSTINVKNMSIIRMNSLGNKSEIKDHVSAVNPLVFESLTLIGKSLGGKKIMQAYCDLKNHVDSFCRASLVFIDAHSPFLNYYGRYRGMSIDTLANVSSAGNGVRVWNAYQRNKRPYGCVVMATGECKSIKIDDENVDHFNIVNTVDVMRSISEAMNWSTLGM